MDFNEGRANKFKRNHENSLFRNTAFIPLALLNQKSLFLLSIICKHAYDLIDNIYLDLNTHNRTSSIKVCLSTFFIYSIMFMIKKDSYPSFPRQKISFMQYNQCLVIILYKSPTRRICCRRKQKHRFLRQEYIHLHEKEYRLDSRT